MQKEFVKFSMNLIQKILVSLVSNLDHGAMREKFILKSCMPQVQPWSLSVIIGR
jgi:hypothetical protein